VTDWLKNANPDFKKSFAKAGKKEWLKFEILDRGQFSLYVADDLVAEESEMVKWKIYNSVNSADILIHYAVSRMFAFGPKVFYPTYEQCEALEHVTVDIPLRDYQQIFEVVTIYFPKEYQDKVTKEFNYPCPLGVMSLRVKEEFAAFCSLDQHPASNLVRTMTLENNDVKTVEDSIKATDKMMRGEKPENFKPGEIDCGYRIHQLAINLNLLLAQYPIKVENSPEREKYLEGFELKPRTQRREIMKEADLLPQIISFEQHVRVREIEGQLNPQGGSHASPTVHWRKGHWRIYQAERFVNMKGKKQFIKPVMVCAYKFAGDPSATKVEYKA
jgi:hypothetical protein